MIAYRVYNTKVYYYGTNDTSSNADCDASDTTTYTYSDGWQEVNSEDLVCVQIEEPAQEQDEPDTGERPVYWERPQRRLATVRIARDRPRQLESTFG